GCGRRHRRRASREPASDRRRPDPTRPSTAARPPRPLAACRRRTRGMGRAGGRPDARAVPRRPPAERRPVADLRAGRRLERRARALRPRVCRCRREAPLRSPRASGRLLASGDRPGRRLRLRDHQLPPQRAGGARGSAGPARAERRLRGGLRAAGAGAGHGRLGRRPRRHPPRRTPPRGRRRGVGGLRPARRAAQAGRLHRRRARPLRLLLPRRAARVPDASAAATAPGLGERPSPADPGRRAQAAPCGAATGAHGRRRDSCRRPAQRGRDRGRHPVVQHPCRPRPGGARRRQPLRQREPSLLGLGRRSAPQPPRPPHPRLARGAREALRLRAQRRAAHTPHHDAHPGRRGRPLRAPARLREPGGARGRFRPPRDAPPATLRALRVPRRRAARGLHRASRAGPGRRL
ncbi:MAG: hypothetical protein AVDCRST_MAG38-2541, partial [uncultured Solirubrobacteraceae bacterium]